MSDVMLYGVLRMPYEMAMGSEMSRYQFYQRAQEAATRLEAAEAELAALKAQPAQAPQELTTTGVDRQISQDLSINAQPAPTEAAQGEDSARVEALEKLRELAQSVGEDGLWNTAGAMHEAIDILAALQPQEKL